MTTCPTTHAEELAYGSERRFEPREHLAAELWMIDHQGETVLRCQCMDVSKGGMRLRVPLGYGVAEGQRYELRSQVPGVARSIGPRVVDSRWATIVRAQPQCPSEMDHVEVGVVLDEVDLLAQSALR